MLFCKLCVCDNPLVRAATSACFSKATMWESIFRALNRLRECAASYEIGSLLNASHDTLGVWAQFVVLHHDSWPTTVKAYEGPPPHPLGAGLEEVAVHEDDAEDAMPPQIPDDAPFIGPIAMFQCSMCEFLSRTRAGLRMHERRAHKHFDALSLRTSGPKCPCCDLNFGLRTRVLDHYTAPPSDAGDSSWNIVSR
eukprot:4255073-Amphidinium_carterae.2